MEIMVIAFIPFRQIYWSIMLQADAYTSILELSEPTHQRLAVTYNVMTDGVVSTTGGNLTSGSETVAANGTTTGSKASANDYYLFVGWYNASGTLLTTNATLSGQTITGATTFTAKFVKSACFK